MIIPLAVAKSNEDLKVVLSEKNPKMKMLEM
jgi:hypothetical protein